MSKMKKDFRQAVMAIFVNEEGRILIGSSPRDGGFKIPQGGLDPGETALEGVKREVYEELGIRLKDSDFFEPVDQRVHYYFPRSEPHRNNFIGQEFHIFKIRYNDSMNPIPQDNEFDKLIWINPEKINNYETRHRTKAYKLALQIYGLLPED